MGGFLWKAAKVGDLEILKWAFENGCPWNIYEDYNLTIWEQAGRNGNVEVIKLLLAMEKEPTYGVYADIGGFAVGKNHFDALKFVLKHKAVRIGSMIEVDDRDSMPTTYWLWKQM